MKSKTIKTVIAKKINDWAKSITDESLRNRVLKGTVVTGGCIASMLLQEKVNDFDVYFLEKDLAADVAQYYIDKFNIERGIEAEHSQQVAVVDGIVRITTPNGYRGETRMADDEIAEMQDSADGLGGAEDKELINEIIGSAEATTPKEKYRPVFISSNAITLSDKIQIVVRFYGEPDVIHENYDFVHCTNHWRSDTGHLELKADALEALLTRELRYAGSKYPVCSVVRMRKFIKRGWCINAGQILKMCMQIAELDLTDPKVLEEQLTGVDALFFMQLIECIKDKDPSKVNATYIAAIIDKIF